MIGVPFEFYVRFPVNRFMYVEQVRGEVSYNGHKMNEFVPQKTSAYISQNDVHVGEMTVKETFDFSARCQGVGTRYGTTESSFHRTLLDMISRFSTCFTV